MGITVLYINSATSKGGPARRRCGFLNAHAGRGSHRRTQWNTWLSYLLILEERYSQCCASARAGEPFRGRPLYTDSHYWYTSHIHPPTRSTAVTRKSTHTYTLPQATKDMRRIEMYVSLFQRQITCSMHSTDPVLCWDISALLRVTLANIGNVRKMYACTHTWTE